MTDYLTADSLIERLMIEHFEPDIKTLQCIETPLTLNSSQSQKQEGWGSTEVFMLYFSWQKSFSLLFIELRRSEHFLTSFDP